MPQPPFSVDENEHWGETAPWPHPTSHYREYTATEPQEHPCIAFQGRGLSSSGVCCQGEHCLSVLLRLHGCRLSHCLLRSAYCIGFSRCSFWYYRDVNNSHPFRPGSLQSTVRGLDLPGDINWLLNKKILGSEHI